ncbi:MAG: fasciclin domain-containing protein [Salinimicrobium sediminis]|nr:fasciclin domain-containing protein [Salinimicrobium sediminis]
MKTTKLFSLPGLSLRLLVLVAFSLLISSCSGEDLNIPAESTVANLESSAVAAAKKGAPAPGEKSIATIAGESGFNELLKALTFVDDELQTQLVALFSTGTDQYTVFAPTDAAFANLYLVLEVEGIDELSAELVRDVLLYHVVEGRRAANSVVPPMKDRNIETLLGVNFTVDPEATIHAVGNTASIETANISASNGIIHIIDAVLLPIE